MAILIMAKVLWQMLLSLDVQLYKNEYIDKMTNLKIYFTTRILSSFINSCFFCCKLAKHELMNVFSFLSQLNLFTHLTDDTFILSFQGVKLVIY